MSTVAGFHVPAMPLSDVPGKVGTDPPAHMVREVPKENRGGVLEFTDKVKLVVLAHCPAPGVKV